NSSTSHHAPPRRRTDGGRRASAPVQYYSCSLPDAFLLPRSRSPDLADIKRADREFIPCFFPRAEMPSVFSAPRRPRGPRRGPTPDSSAEPRSRDGFSSLHHRRQQRMALEVRLVNERKIRGMDTNSLLRMYDLAQGVVTHADSKVQRDRADRTAERVRA